MSLLFFDPFGPALSPIAFALIAAAGAVYARGMGRSRLWGEQVKVQRHVLFWVGLVFLLACLDAPLASEVRSSFLVHQIQHLFLRLLGPMLICLSHPISVLRSGLPSRTRRAIGVATRRWRDRSTATWVDRPVLQLLVAFLFLVLSFYLWQWPTLQNFTVQMPALLLLAHASMIGAGLVFFGLVLDRRDVPDAAPHTGRLLVLIGFIISNIALGSLLTFKQDVLYTVYGMSERALGLMPLSDESGGGYTIWVPSSLVAVAAAMMVFNGWNAAEVRRWEGRYDWSPSNSAMLEFPETAEELYLKVTGPNRRLGLTLAAATVTMFVIVLVTAITVSTLSR